MDEKGTAKSCQTCANCVGMACLKPACHSYDMWEPVEEDSQAVTLENRIIKWGVDRNLYDVATMDSQIGKFFEEFSEWMAEVITGDKAAEKVEFGDMYVVLTHLAKIRGLSFTACGEAAYQKIKDRTGHNNNGTFVKD